MSLSLFNTFNPLESALTKWPNEDFWGFDESRPRRGRGTTGGSLISRPRMDLIDGKDNMTAVIEVPGIPKEKVNIELQDNVLTISGSVEHTNESQAPDASYSYSERRYGSFARSIAVPAGLKEDEIKATFDNGLLKVAIPKQGKETAAKKITIS